MERIEALAELLGAGVDDLTVSEYDDRVYGYEFSEYIVLTEDETYDAAKENLRNLIEECGLELFSKDYQERVLDNCVDKEWFDGYLEEYYTDYIDEIRDEDSSYKEYETMLDEEMDNAGVDTEEEFLNYLIEGADDPIEWYKDCFGYEDFKTTCEENDLIDWDSVIEESIEKDGVAHSIAYDGKQYEVDEYFIYRIG